MVPSTSSPLTFASLARSRARASTNYFAESRGWKHAVLVQGGSRPCAAGLKPDEARRGAARGRPSDRWATERSRSQGRRWEGKARRSGTAKGRERRDCSPRSGGAPTINAARANRLIRSLFRTRHRAARNLRARRILRDCPRRRTKRTAFPNYSPARRAGPSDRSRGQKRPGVFSMACTFVIRPVDAG